MKLSTLLPYHNQSHKYLDPEDKSVEITTNPL